MQIRVSTSSNIALVKYWGKSDAAINQPAAGSLSVGLDALRTNTSISTHTGADEISIAGKSDHDSIARVKAFVDHCRRSFRFTEHFLIESRNNFPTAAGLASSASGFAALAIGINRMMGLDLDSVSLSRLARRGSGSAARSVFGGFVEVIPDEDAYATVVSPADHWQLSVVVAITDEGSKQIGSTDAMNRTAKTSPYYQNWLSSHAEDLQAARRAVLDRDFDLLAGISEFNCLKMHAAIMTSRPPVIYWSAATLAVMQKVQALRDEGLPVFFTVDAGPQVKVFTLPEHEGAVAREIQGVHGVLWTIQTNTGGDPVVEVIPS